MTPARGLALIRRPTVANSLGKIQLLDKTVTGWSLGQAILVALGPPIKPEDPDDYDGELVNGEVLQDPRLTEGAWILTRFRSWFPSDDPDLFVIRQEDIVAILQED